MDKGRGGELKDAVKDRYGRAAKGESFADVEGRADSRAAGYTDEMLRSVPDTADLGLGCGTPLLYAALKAGDTVIDLGCGGGLDCLLAARQVGETGRVIGLDMTPEMVELARCNVSKSGSEQVEILCGDIEHIPIGDETADAVISNCVINLCEDKLTAFREAFRVLKVGGRLCLSDIVRVGASPKKLSQSLDAYTACLSGASPKEEYLDMLRSSGFSSVSVLEEKTWPFFRGFAKVVIVSWKSSQTI